MLRIMKASDPVSVDQLVVCIYSPPGLGKTSLSFTAHDALLFDFDAGAYRSANRGDSVPVRSWGDLVSMTADDFKPYRSLVVDTVGRCLDALAADIILRDAKLGRNGSLTLQGYGRLKAEFTAWLKLVRSFGKDVILIAHSDEQRNGDDTLERIDAQGSSKNEIYKVSDAMARLSMHNGGRVLLFSPSDTAFGKNPAGLEPLPVPTFDSGSRFLGEVVETIKAHLNKMTEEQSQVAAVLTEWASKLSEATTAAAMTKLIQQIEKLDARARDNAKRALWSYAKDHGCDYDKNDAKFIERKAVA